ncbi:MAG: RICIN domain-containing protein [Akkermansiaceae bacterium]|nr:RICIN domain-containing protein [Verrucomicrobiales bacterium]
MPRQASGADVLTQHNDQWRTGANTSETILTPANVNSASFGKLFSYAVDGSVYAQPLYVGGLSIGGGTHNVVYVATMEDSVYAFDADSNVTYWRARFTGGSITPVPIVDLTGSNNLNIHGNVGILSTPVIDRASGTIYVLARTKDTSNSTYQQKLHALSLSTGAEKFGGPKTITASGFNSKIQAQRPALALANGNVYIAWGSHEDKGAYHGYVMAYNATTLAQVAVFNTTPNGNMGAIWQAGQGPAIDGSGNLYFMTGNGDWDGVTKWGQSFLKLSPALKVLDWFTPDNYASMNNSDIDFGAAGAVLLPGSSGYPSTSRVIGGGKEGKIFVLDNNNGMGRKTSGNTGAKQVWQATQTASCSHHIHGSPIYWNSASQGKVIYVWGENDTGKGFKYNGATFTTTPFTKTAAKAPTTGCGMPGSVLSLSANGTGNGIVWANCVYTGDALHNTVPGILRAYNADNLGSELWNSRMNLSRDNLGNLAKYVPPTVVNGKVYMATFSGTVNVYGLLNTGGDVVTPGTYKIVARHSGKALTAFANATTNGTPMVQLTYSAASSQRWTVSSLGNNQYRIVGVGSGKSMDVKGAGTANGTAVTLYTSSSGNNQKWTFTKTDSGYYRLTPANAPASCLDVAGRSLTDNAVAQLWTFSGGANQQWILQAP